MKRAFIFLIVFIALFSSNIYANPKIDVFKISKSLKKEVQKKLQEQYPYVLATDIKIKVHNLEKLKNNIPDKASSFKINLTKSTKVLGNTVLKINFLNSHGNFIDSYSIFVNVKGYANFISAKRKIYRGEVISKEDLKEVYLEIYNIPRDAVLDFRLLDGKEAVCTIQENVVLLNWMLKKVPLIRSGDNIRVNFQNQNVKLDLDGKALEDGYLGKYVRIKLHTTDKILKGEVIGTKNVKIYRNY